jgi:uncharacterized protein (TIGR02594 family)
MISDIQRTLKNAGFNPGGIDGQWGPLTQAALDSYERQNKGAQIPPWLLVAERELGVHEITGAKHNARILEYHRHTSLQASSDEVAWCSSFANYCMDIAGLHGTHSASAASWLDWGKKLVAFQYGCVCVFNRTGGNHVAFGVWQDVDNDGIYVLGGNQSNSVCVTREPLGRLRGYRWA